MLGVSFRCGGGYFLYYYFTHSNNVSVSLHTERELRELATNVGFRFFYFWGMIGIYLGLKVAPIVEEEVNNDK